MINEGTNVAFLTISKPFEIFFFTIGQKYNLKLSPILTVGNNKTKEKMRNLLDSASLCAKIFRL